VTSKRPAWWRSALAALLPAGIVLVLIAVLFRSAPQHFLPVWSDEVVYWNEAAVFAEAGFDGGYVTVHEEVAAATFSRFGPHGPVFAVFHGSLARIVGWQPPTAFFINLVVVSLAAFAWVRGTAAGTSPPALLLLAGFWPLLLYLPTQMQEPTHFALAFLFALAIARDRDRAGARTYTWTALLLVAAALLRPSWALLILPLGWRHARRAGPRGIGVLLFATLLASAAAFALFGTLASPSPNTVHAVTEALTEEPARVPAMVIGSTVRNLEAWFGFGEDKPPEVVFRYFTALLIGILLVRCTVWRPDASAAADALEAALLAVAPVFAFTVLIGDVESWRDFRLIAPHVLVALLLLVSHTRWERWLWAGTLVLLPLYYRQFIEFHEGRFTGDRDAIAAMREATATVIPFVPDASPWSNTVAVSADLLQFPLLGVPRGIGISYVADWLNHTSDVRSAYVLLHPADRMEAEKVVKLEPLVETPLGTLYRNAGPAR
jgi:hypothetical protein